MEEKVEEIDKSLFEFVQQDKKIHDTKFESKPTTFLQDAFKRFYKNKSSVIGAIIISIIVLLALLLPSFSPYETKEIVGYQAFAPAKVFKAGTGFWDGTERRTEKTTVQVGDEYLPAGIENKIAIVPGTLKVYEKDGVMLCDYTYDYYAEKFGTYEDQIDIFYLNEYQEKKWVEFTKVETTDNKYRITNFKVINDKSPIREIDETTEFDTDFITAVIDHAKKQGYDKAPNFIFGTDSFGHDILTLTFSGLRISLILAIIVSAICFTIGICWGAISGYFGGNIDLAMERFCEILGGLPWLAVVTLFTLHFGKNIVVFIVALCFTGWLGIAGRTRTQFYRFKGREYVLASRTLGAKDTRLIFKHILPNSLGTIVTTSVLMIPGIMFSESTLAYLGLKIADYASFGQILSDNQAYLSTQPMLVMFPAIVLSLLMISFNLFGNGLRDALNPSLKGSE